jgi:hypothetical protein
MEEPTSHRIGLYPLLSAAAFLSFFFAPTVLAKTAPPYELVAFENSHYRDFTRAELETAIGADAVLLSDHACDGRQERELLPEPAPTNLGRDSLRVRASRTGEIYLYREGRFHRMDGAPIPRPEGAFFADAASALVTLEKLPHGRALLRLLEKSRFPLVLEPGKWMRFNPSDDGRTGSGLQMASALMIFHRGRKTTENLPFRSIGVGGEIIWDPHSTMMRTESDGKKRIVPPHVSLAHEMYHAFDSVRGLLDTRLVWGPSDYEATQVLEYRAVYFENQVRAESGIRYAKYYGSEEGADLLDDQGVPILMPAPCL